MRQHLLVECGVRGLTSLFFFVIVSLVFLLKFGGFHPQTDGSVEKEANLGGSQSFTSMISF